MPTAVRSHCKINLGLAVGPPRADGFHGLTTMYQTLALHDIVTISARPAPVTRIELHADHPGVPCTAKGNASLNTAFRMVEGALARLGIAAEVRIDLAKRLPVQGGLGAGSANAAAALIGLERELGVALPGSERLELAEAIGSDVPLFLLGGNVLGLDRGQSVFPLPDLPSLPVVVAVPSVGVSTGQAFRALDGRTGLTPDALSTRLSELSRVLASAWSLPGKKGPGKQTLSGSPVSEKGDTRSPEAEGPRQATGLAAGVIPEKGVREPETAATGGLTPRGESFRQSLETAFSPENTRDTEAFSYTADKGIEAESLRTYRTLLAAGLVNDFEDVAFIQHPSLRSLKDALAGSTNAASEPALYAALSGSGSALFGLYRTPAAARAAQARVEALHAGAVLTRTLTRDEYWQDIFA